MHKLRIWRIVHSTQSQRMNRNLYYDNQIYC